MASRQPSSSLRVPFSSTNSGLRLLPRCSRRSPSQKKTDLDGSPRMYGCGFSLFRSRRSRSTTSIPRLAVDTAAAPPPRTGSGEISIVPVRSPAPPVAKSQSPVPTVRAAAASAPRPKKPANAAPGNGIMAELDSMLSDRQRADGGGHLVRVSSGNVMVYGNLGNLRGGSNLKNPPSRDVLDYLPKTAKELSMELEGKTKNDHGGLAMTTATKNPGTGNEMRTAEKETTAAASPEPAPGSYRALSRMMDPEELKEMGNDEYKKGRFAEALALYDRAIAMDPGKASYYSNRAAAFTGMGRLLEAVGECKEAIRIDPAYYRAHHRLATLYLRLGEAEKATHHFKQSRNVAGHNDISRAQALHSQISKSNEARKLKDYVTLLKESKSAASSGADSAPQVFALQAEALLKLHRHDEAESILSSAPKFDDELTKFFGANGNAYFLIIQAQVDMATGRFEDAVAKAQRAAQLDPSNREISAVVRRTRAVASARSRGNDLFRTSKFAEACIAYGNGLEHDSHNAVLLCNRAACRYQLRHYEKAIEDCNTALIVRPSYSKARRRRAECNAKLERWEASIKDYGVLVQQNPGDEEVSKAMAEAQAKVKKQ